MGKRAFNRRFLAVLVVSDLSFLVPLEQSQAQLFLHFYPSQDNNNQTLWIFRVSSTTHTANSIRTPTVANSNNYNGRDTFQFTGGSSGNIFGANKP